MSGEAGGVIVGGILLVGALPYILAGAAVVGCAVGVASLGKELLQSRERRREASRLETEHCSAELSALYGKLRAAVDEQFRQNNECDKRMEAQLRQLSGQLRQAAGEEGNSNLTHLLQQGKKESAQMIGEARQAELSRIRRESEAETAAVMVALQDAQRAKMDLLDWKADTAAARAGQKALAGELVRDAEATLRLLRSLSAGAGNFQLRVNAMERSCQVALQAMEAEAYEVAAAGAQQVISRGAELALEEERKRLEIDEAAISLEARLESLLSQMESQRCVTFDDPCYGPTEEYLNDFTQGEFARVSQLLRDLLDELRSPEGRRYSLGKLQLLLEEVDEELAPQVETVLQSGHAELLHYYERLHALQVVGDYMKEQGYTMDWAQTAGDDATQKLVVHFTEPVNHNTVAVSLDEDTSAHEIGQMAMGVMFYYASGRPVTEEEKETLRSGMMGALMEKGLRGELQCTDCVHQEAADKTMDHASSVRDLAVTRSVLGRDGTLWSGRL